MLLISDAILRAMALRASVEPKQKAYAMLAYDEAGEDHALWRAIAIATQLREVTNHTIVIQTNTEKFGDGSYVAPKLKSALGVVVKRVSPNDIDIPKSWMNHSFKAGCRRNCWKVFSKLRAWTWTEYRTVVMMDTDSAITRTLDELLENKTFEHGTWFQQGISCSDTWACAGFLVLQPSQEQFREIQRYVHSLSEPPRQAEQTVLQNMFKTESATNKGPWNLVPRHVAQFHQCVMGAAPLPAFIHKPRGAWGGTRLNRYLKQAQDALNLTRSFSDDILKTREGWSA